MDPRAMEEDTDRAVPPVTPEHQAGAGLRGPGAHSSRLAATLTRNDRFLSVRMLASIAVYLVVAASYVQARITDDGVIYYDFMRRLSGEDVHAYAYQFGVVVWNTPFYLLSRLVVSARGSDSVGDLSIGAASVAFASSAAVLAIFYVSWRLLRGLGVRGGPGATLLTVFGSPLFYYAIFQPGLKHAFDALLASLLALLLLQASVRPTAARAAVSIGVVLALLISVRYANITLLAGPVYVYVRTRAFSQAYLASAVAVVGATVILLVPFVLGISYGLPPAQSAQTQGLASTHVGVAALVSQRVSFAASAPPRRPATGNSGGGGVDSLSSFQLDPLAPVKMLFTFKRGLFLWTPLTFLGVIGYLLLLRRMPQQRVFLVGLGLGSLALLLIHMLWGAFWVGGYSFSQRFLTSLFPLFVIGTAELLSRTRMLVAPLLVVCVAWTGFLAVHHFYGYDSVSDRDGVGRIVDLYRTGEETPDSFWQRVSGPVGRHWSAYFEWLDVSSADESSAQKPVAVSPHGVRAR